jgi:hypothetical protein
MCAVCGGPGFEEQMSDEAKYAAEQNLTTARHNWDSIKGGATTFKNTLNNVTSEILLAQFAQRLKFLVAEGELDLETFLQTVSFGILEQHLPLQEMPPMVVTEKSR